MLHLLVTDKIPTNSAMNNPESQINYNFGECHSNHHDSRPNEQIDNVYNRVIISPTNSRASIIEKSQNR